MRGIQSIPNIHLDDVIGADLRSSFGDNRLRNGILNTCVLATLTAGHFVWQEEILTNSVDQGEKA